MGSVQVGARRRMRRCTALAATVVLAVLSVGLLQSQPAAAETTTSAPSTVTSTTAGATVTTAASTATTAAGTGTTTVPAAAGTPGVNPAPAGWQPLNPGIAPAEIFTQVWPEYDTTSQEVLVLVDLTVPDSVALPFTFKFAVPKGARVTGFAQVTPDGSYDYNRPSPQFSSGGADYDLVTVSVPAYRSIHLEYYYNPGMPASGAKTLSVVFISPADTPKLSLVVQQPKRSTDFSVTPAGTTSGPGSDGYVYVADAFTGVKDGDRVQVDVSYTKNDSNPSESTGTTADAGQSQSTRWFLVFLIVLVVAVVAIVVYRLFFQKRGPKGSPPPGKGTGGQRAGGGSGASTPRDSGAGSRRTSGPSAEPQGPGSGGPARFCTQCGTRLSKKDRFCPQCGHEREG